MGASAARYVDFMGGADAVLRRGRDSFAVGDFRWVAQVVNHVLFAGPGKLTELFGHLSEPDPDFAVVTR